MKSRTVIFSMLITAVGIAAPATLPAQDTGTIATEGVSLSFLSDPRGRSDVMIEGGALERLSWQADPPAFPGDRPGSLTALYNARMEAGRFGVPLPGIWNQDDVFTAAAVFVIEADGFTADPNGFFEISWGLWNSAEPGLDRTGDLDDFASDTFEVLEFAWFPNQSPFFGGPFLSPSLFGAADGDSPLFPFLGGFANFAFGSVEAELPLAQPLMAVLVHDPATDAVVVSVYRVVNGGRVVPVPGALAVIDLTMLGERAYELDVLGLTLWRDGFSGDEPSLNAQVTFHQLVAVPGTVERLEALLLSPPTITP